MAEPLKPGQKYPTPTKGERPLKRTFQFSIMI